MSTDSKHQLHLGGIQDGRPRIGSSNNVARIIGNNVILHDVFEGCRHDGSLTNTEYQLHLSELYYFRFLSVHIRLHLNAVIIQYRSTFRSVGDPRKHGISV
jgi:hypothetical protein